jgi:hypothetical protein
MYTLLPITQSERVLGRPCKKWEDAVLLYRPHVDCANIDGGGDDDDIDEQIQVSS